MGERELRLECLKLAIEAHRVVVVEPWGLGHFDVADDLIETAKAFEEYVAEK